MTCVLLIDIGSYQSRVHMQNHGAYLGLTSEAFPILFWRNPI